MCRLRPRTFVRNTFIFLNLPKPVSPTYSSNDDSVSDTVSDLSHERGPAAAARGAAAAAGAREHHVDVLAGEVCKRAVSVVRRGVRGLLLRVHGQGASHHHGNGTHMSGFEEVRANAGRKKGKKIVRVV